MVNGGLSQYNKKMKKNLYLLIVFILATGCFNPFNPREGKGVYPLPTEPEIVINNLVLAYSTKDLNGYIKCLDPDSFRFYFDDSEDSIREILERNWGIDSLSWGLAEEIISARNIFNNVDEINLELTGGRGIPIGDNKWIFIYNYSLNLIPTPAGINSIEGHARFILRKRPEDNLWYIMTWEDYAF